jgi:hypothetical protein
MNVIHFVSYVMLHPEGHGSISAVVGLRLDGRVRWQQGDQKRHVPQVAVPEASGRVEGCAPISGTSLSKRHRS